MEKIISLFHKISMIKYPILILGMYYIYKPMIWDLADPIPDINTGLLLFSFGIGIDALKDYNKLNWLDKKVYHNPKTAKVFFLIFGLFLAAVCLWGIINYRTHPEGSIRELSLGIFSLGVGGLGILKAGIESTKAYIEEQNYEKSH